MKSLRYILSSVVNSKLLIEYYLSKPVKNSYSPNEAPFSSFRTDSISYLLKRNISAFPFSIK